jgi:hypothetical protein
LYSVVDGRAATIVQAMVSAIAFVVLAVALASTLRNQSMRVGLMAVILLLGIAPRVTVWDAALLTESLAISLSALLIAALIWLDHLPPWTVIALFCLWVFLRDPHLYLGFVVLAGVVVWAWRRRRWAIPVAMFVVLVWAGAAAQRNDEVEAYNVTTNLAWHGEADIDMWRWFVDRGMHPSAGFIYSDLDDRQAALQADPEFWKWAQTDGPRLYARYLVTHPAWTLSKLKSMFADDGANHDALVDQSTWMMTGLPAGPWSIWPNDASLYTAALLVLGLIGGLVLIMRGYATDRSVILAGALAASTVPHALLAYHATPYELARHGAIMSFVLVVAFVWIIALALDRGSAT